MCTNKNFLFTVIILSTFFITSCIDKNEYSTTPSIAFKDFIKRGADSADFIITFKDGDGNLGLNDWDTTGEFSSTGPYYYNMTMNYFVKNIVSGEFEQFVLPGGDTLRYSYRLPDITPKGQNKALAGEIMVNMLAPYYYPGHTTIRFDVFIYDREHNKSNVITTPEIIVP